MKKRSQVVSPRPSIIRTQEAAPRIGTIGTSGVLNGRFMPGSTDLRIHTPRQTSTKAKSVPILVSSAISLIGTRLAVRPTATPVRTVGIDGVLYLGWIRLKAGGSNPSREIA